MTAVAAIFLPPWVLMGDPIRPVVAAAATALIGDKGLPRPDSPPPGSDGTESPDEDSEELEVDLCLANTSPAMFGVCCCCCCYKGWSS